MALPSVRAICRMGANCWDSAAAEGVHRSHRALRARNRPQGPRIPVRYKPARTNTSTSEHTLAGNTLGSKNCNTVGSSVPPHVARDKPPPGRQ